MKLEGKKVLVTGAGGFIGSHLVEALVGKGCKVRAFVRYNGRGDWGHLESIEKRTLDEIETISSDITDPFAVRQAVAGCDVVFHLAALIAIPYSYIAPYSYVTTNVTGTLNVLEACRAQGIGRLVHTSTSETYGTAQYTPIDERHPLQGQSPYSASKISADKLAESYFLSFGLPVSTCRPFNTYGPRQSARAIIPSIISQLLSGASELRLGLLTPIRDFNYVKDTVNGFIRVAEADAAIGEVVNIGSGAAVTIGKLVEKIVQLTGKKVTIVSEEARIRPVASEVMELLCDNSKAMRLIGWEPRYTLDDGLKEVIEYIGARLNTYKPSIYNV